MSRTCWCGNQGIRPFGGGYDLCAACTTLICHDDLPAPPPSPGGVDAAEAGYYGEHYWFEHQQQDLGLPPLHVRARQDLTERNLHWLATMLSYRQPPALAGDNAELPPTTCKGDGAGMQPWRICRPNAAGRV